MYPQKAPIKSEETTCSYFLCLKFSQKIILNFKFAVVKKNDKLVKEALLYNYVGNTNYYYCRFKL